MKRFPLWHLAAIAVLCVLVYANALSGEFVWDDETQIVKNVNLRSFENVPSAFTSPFWGFVNTTAPNQTNFYRPLQTLAYMAGYAMGELSPGPYHAISLTLHVAASILAYLICIELGLAPGLTLLAAALFAVHPVHTEAVTWIAGVPDVACAVFYFAALWTFLKSREGEDKGWLWASAGLLLPALLAKEIAATLPLVIGLYLYRPGGSRRIAALAPYVAPAAVYVALRANALGFLATTQTDIRASFLDWVTLVPRVFGQYVLLVVAPYPLKAYQLIEVHLADRMAATALALAFAAGLAAVAWKFRAWFWYAVFAVMLIPVFYFQGISNALLAERYLYIPSLAAVVLAGTLLARVPKLVWAGWVVVALFAGLTMARNLAWASSERLYVDSVEKEPEAGHMRVNLAEVLLKRGDDRNAAEHLNAALVSFNSGKYSQIPYDAYRAHIGLGAIQARAQQFGDAVEHLETAKRIYPNGEWPYLYLGGIAMQAEGNDAKAVELLETAVKLGPLNEVARDYLGIALFNQGRVQEARKQFQEALRINPTHGDARNHLQMADRALAGQ